MADTAQPGSERKRSRLGGAASVTFRALFAFAVIIAAGATIVAVTDSSPNAASQPWLLALLLGNLVLIAGIAALLGGRVLELLRENRETGGSARLRLRITALFSLAAAIPTIIVAGFLAVMITRSVENWFSAPVTRIIEGGANAARATVNDLTQEAMAEVDAMRGDIAGQNAAACSGTLAALEQCTRLRAEYRGLFRRIEAYDGTGRRLFELAAAPAAAAEPPTANELSVARTGTVSIKEDRDAIRIFFKVPSFEDVYLKVARSIPETVRARLTEADESLREFRAAEARRRQLSAVITLSYIEAALLMLLGTAWLGMAAARRIAEPVGQLAQAARAVRDGDLSVRAPRPNSRDEIDDLAGAFNQMTDRLSRQTRDLDRARRDAEARTAFIEAVLSGVEAGVVRVGGDLAITIANTSAESLLDFTFSKDEPRALADVAPEFVAAARRAIDTEQSVESSVRRSTPSGARHFHVRAAAEDMGDGAVITFHDTTRLVMGQRQAAWRDVARRIAHEIRNPLTPIQLSAERLRRRFSGQILTDRDTFERCTDTITRQVADIGRMVEEFSGFAQMPKPTIGEFNLVDVLEAVAFSQRMRTPDIAVTVNAGPAALLMWGDERMLAQAFTNVLKNAGEAVERRASRDSSIGTIAIDVREEEDDIFLIVRDNGPGLPLEDRERLLEPYVTLRREGVGLGLAIVNRIIEDHGGLIRLGDNELAPSGARVEIRLPRRPVMSDEFAAYAGEGVAQ
jgi:two-component system, NtrC family, nitrogen regulation sensor histidine kinase NtrY